MNNKENQCDTCALFDVYENMLKDGFEPKEAFHEVIEHAQSQAYEDGLVDGLISVVKNVGKQIDNIIGECDCEECNGKCDEDIN